MDPEHHVHPVVPRDEGEIGVGALVPDQPLLPPQRLFQDAENPFHLVRVPLDGGRQLFGMEHVEPDRASFRKGRGKREKGDSDDGPAALPEVGPLSAHLEHEPLVEEVLLAKRFEREPLLTVILFDQIQYNSARLPEGEVGVRIDDGLQYGSAGVFHLIRQVRRRSFRYSPGARPFGLTSIKGDFLMSSKRMDLIS